MADALLHIGLHKTGTTAFQQWASHIADTLLTANGIRYYDGMFGSCHYELGLLAVGPGRTTAGMDLQPQWPLAEWQDNAARHVRAQAAPDDTTLLISSEELSLLRNEHEVRTVCDLLAPRQLRVAVCLRSPESWLESYRQQHLRHGYLSEFRSSHAYVGPDTWLTDWDQMLRVWRNVLGDENVVTCDYDDSVARFGSSILAVLTALGIDPDKVPPWQGFVANVTPGHTGPLDAWRQPPQNAFVMPGVACGRFGRRTRWVGRCSWWKPRCGGSDCASPLRPDQRRSPYPWETNGRARSANRPAAPDHPNWRQWSHSDTDVA